MAVKRLTVPGGSHRFARMHALPGFGRVIIVVAALLLTGAGAHGARVDQLYTAEAGPADLELIGIDAEEAQEAGRRSLRRDLMRAALARVLIRVAGNAAVAADDELRQGLIDRAPSLVNRFHFLKRDGPEGPRIQAQFDAEGVREGLWQAGWPVWGALRPGLLVWVAQRDGGSLELVGPDSSPEVFEALRQAAQQRGLPLVLPLMDGTDRRNLAGRDLLMEDWAAIGEASERYEAGAIVVLRLATGRDGTRAEWVLRDREGNYAFTTRGSQPEEALADGMQSVLEGLARKHAVRPGGASSVQVTVDGIQGLAEFARVERALGQLVAVQELAPKRLIGDKAGFQLAFRGRPDEAARILGLLDLLEPRGDPLASDGNPDGARGEQGQGGESPLMFNYRP